MTRYLLLGLFMVTISAPTFGMDLSLAPGLSLKNAILYAVAFTVLLEAALLVNRRIEMLSVIGPFTLLVGYAFLTWIVVVLLFDLPGYRPLPAFILLKSSLADQLLVFLVFFYGVVNRRDAMWLVRAMVWVVAIIVSLTAIDGLDMPDLGLIETNFEGRLVGPVGEANEFGAFLAFFLPSIVILFGTSKGGAKIMALTGLVATVMCLLMAFSRGAFVAIALGTVAGSVLLRRHIDSKGMLKAALTVAALCACAVVLIVATDYREVILDRLAQTGGGDLTYVSSGRTAIWMNALEKMMQHPVTLITGFGWDSYESTGGFRYATHSVYMHYLYNLGLIGLSLFLVVSINVIRGARRSLDRKLEAERWHVITLIFGLVNILIAAAFLDMSKVWFFVWALSGATLRLVLSDASDRDAVVAGDAGSPAVQEVLD